MFDTSNIGALLRATRGAPLTVLLAMIVEGRPVGPGRLSAILGYQRPTIRRALALLLDLQLVVHVGRYDAWLPTASATSLPFLKSSNREGSFLSDEGKFLSNEGSFLSLPETCSSSLDHDHDIDHDLEDKLLLHVATKDKNHPSLDKNRPSRLEDDRGKDKNLPSRQDDPARLVEVLVGRGGTLRRRAIDAIRMALASGRNPVDIEVDVLLWADYCRSTGGRGINNAGAFIARRIELGESPGGAFNPTFGTEVAIMNVRRRAEENE